MGEYFEAIHVDSNQLMTNNLANFAQTKLLCDNYPSPEGLPSQS